MIPSMVPSFVPSMFPSMVPSDVPSDSPSSLPSFVPSMIPSDVPSDSPSMRKFFLDQQFASLDYATHQMCVKIKWNRTIRGTLCKPIEDSNNDAIIS